ncbi:fimbria/pilus outer membrane usher protein (plasmid) [Ralstonia syzygii]|uniref:Fimbria/pilus outer membrane usher protein n=1 Tax=Ralstonia syzygii TaxID=28097 RepID=A0ABX7ZP09_9RALS|nr:fimbria/pilus outer membrane usher protein [Ralstonia syzygii]
MPNASTAPAPSHIAAGDTAELLLQFDLNQQGLDETALLLKTKGGGLYASAEDLKRWRLRQPEVTPLAHNNELFYPLKAIATLSYQLDETRMTVAVTAPAQAFLPNAIDEANKPATLAANPGLGGFLNYDLLAEYATGRTRSSGLFEAGVFNGFGVGVASFVATSGDTDHRLTRLETTWTKDLPDHLTSVRLGDAISRAGAWGRSVRFGGIQYGTNFAVQPGFVALPLQSIGGQAALPSTVDVYVNNVLSSRKEVAPGPFSITNVPVVTGQGDVRVVVRDLLGREQVISVPFYASASLLAKGLHDFSYEAGAERKNFGTDSNDYGRAFAAATHRLGFTDWLTGEVRAETELERQTIGLGMVMLAPTVGVFSLAAAASRGQQGNGGLVSFGFERQASPVSLGVHTQLASPRFTQLGLEPGIPAPRLLSSVNVGMALSGNGSLGLAYVYLDNRDGHPTQLASASYGTELGRFGFISLAISKTLHQPGGLIVGLNWTLPLGERTTTSANMTQQQGRTDVQAQVQQGLPPGDGFGYSVRASQLGTWDVALNAQNRVGTYLLEAAGNRGQAAARMGVSGGIAVLDGPHPSRRITDSFAVVKVPDFPNVRIYADNQLVAQTDAGGEALIPRLRAYEKNAISLEQLDLPFDAKVGALSLDAVPYFRSGMVLEFPVAHAHDALLTLRLENGGDLPAGAIVQIDGQRESFPVGNDGVVYLTGLSAQNRLHASWRGQSCDISVPFVPGTEPLPDLGSFVCKGVQP